MGKTIGFIKRCIAAIAAIAVSAGTTALPSISAYADDDGVRVIDVTEFGADPSGKKDSAASVEKAMEYAKTLNVPTKIYFPKGEYHFWEDYAPVRELYVSNTIGDNQLYKNKKIGILVEDMKDVTVDGGDSLFIYHGDITTFASIRSENVTFTNYSFDFASPVVVDITVESKGDNYADVYIPECYNYTIDGTDILWEGEISPTTGKPYWSGKNGLEYAQIYDYNAGRTWRDSGYIFNDVKSIEDIGNSRVRITYNSGNGPEAGYCFQLRNTARTTPGALFWESKNVTVTDMNAHFLHGFGMVGQLSDTITIDGVDFVARKGTGRTTAAFADFIQMSSVKGKITIRNCLFSNPHDDPINIHGTYLSVASVEDNTYTVQYMHNETSGFPQFYVGDEVEFVKKSNLVPVEDSIAKVVAVDGPNPGSLNTIKITLDKEIPEVIGGHLYAVENITYTPEVLIENNRFIEVPTRGVLVTTRRKVEIKNNYFDAMTMPSIFISCDAQSWYESGPARDVIISGNVFDRPYDRAILIQPTNQEEDPDVKVHENIIIENNTFNLIDKPLLEAKSVRNLVVRDNIINRYDPGVKINIAAAETELEAGSVTQLTTEAQGNVLGSALYNFTASCKDVTISNNSYDAGFNIRANALDAEDVVIDNDEVKLGANNNKAPVGTIMYVSSNDEVATVEPGGVVVAKSEGTADIYAYTMAGSRIFESNKITFNVNGPETGEAPDEIKVVSDGNYISALSGKMQFSAETEPSGMDYGIIWQTRDPVSKKPSANAEISQTGLLTALHGGVVEVVAVSAADNSVYGTKLVVIEPMEGILNPAWKIENENTAKWQLSDYALKINAESGGMWGGGGWTKNLFLTDAGSDNFTATVKMTGITTTGYEEAGMIVMTDLDNYAAVVRKNGGGNKRLGFNYEFGGNANESTIDDISSQEVYFKIERSGSRYTVYYSQNGASWQQIGQEDNSSLSGNVKIGVFAGNADGGEYKFENFMLNGNVIPFEETNNPPEADTAQIAASENTLSVSYNYADSDGDEEGASVYRWYMSDTVDGVFVPIENFHTREVTMTAAQAGKYIKAEVCPADTRNAVGAPIAAEAVEAPAQIGEGTDTMLSSLTSSNGVDFDKAFESEVMEYTAIVPAGIAKVRLNAAANNAEAVIEYSINGTVIASGSGSVSEELPLSEEADTILINVSKDGEVNEYTVNIKRFYESEAALLPPGITGVDGFEAFSEDNSFYRTTATVDQDRITMYLEAKSDKAKLQVIENGKVLTDYSDSIYELDSELMSGGNIYEVRVRAEDQLTERLYRFVVNKTGLSNSDAEAIKLNGNVLAGFDKNVYQYSITLNRGESTAAIEVVPVEGYNTVSISVNGSVRPGENVAAELVPGTNKIEVILKAPSGKTTKYTITAFLPSDSNAKLSDIIVGSYALQPRFNEDVYEYSFMVDSRYATVMASPQESGAKVKLILNDTVVKQGKGVQSKYITMEEGKNCLSIEVTSPDGTETKVYNVYLVYYETIYLSNLDWESYSGSAPKKDEAWEYSKIRIPDENGNPVEYEKGIGSHANAEVVYNIEGKGYTKFLADIGVDYVKFTSGEPHIVFAVYVDGEEAYRSEEMYGKTPRKSIAVDVSGAKEIKLAVTQAKHQWSAHADWADARFITDTSECKAADIVIGDKTLDGFEPDKLIYDISVPEGTTSMPVRIVPSPESLDTAVTVNGVKTEGAYVDATLNPGMNKVILAVSTPAQTKKYVVNIVVSSNDNNKLAAIELANGTLSPKFESAVTKYTLNTSAETETLTIKAQQSDRAIKAMYNGKTIKGTGSITVPIDIIKGTNLLTIKCASPDGQFEQVYTIQVINENSTCLSDMEWESATAGDGKNNGLPVKDKAWESDMKLIGMDGNPIPYSKGIGTHANSEIVYNIEGLGFTKFLCDVGLDFVKKGDTWPQLVFEVYVDDELKYQSNTLSGDGAFESIEVDVSGGKKLKLKVVTKSDPNWSAHADWAGARLIGNLSENSDYCVSDWLVTENNAECVVTNLTDEEKTAVMIVANYDDDGALLEVKSTSVTLEANQSQKLQTSEVSANSKVFLWEDMNSMNYIAGK